MDSLNGPGGVRHGATEGEPGGPAAYPGLHANGVCATRFALAGVSPAVNAFCGGKPAEWMSRDIWSYPKRAAWNESSNCASLVYRRWELSNSENTAPVMMTKIATATIISISENPRCRFMFVITFARSRRK